MPGWIEVAFATSNTHKFREASFILEDSGIRLSRLPSKGTEIQSDDVSEIARIAAADAFQKYRRPLFVEDTMLSVDELNGFPGTYSAYVYKSIGPAGVLKLLEGTGTRGGEFDSCVAFVSEGRPPITFVGRLRGSIASRARGRGGFGFDSVFIPTGSVKTLAEMSMAEKCEVSHRSKAIRALASWLETTGFGQPL